MRRGPRDRRCDTEDADETPLTVTQLTRQIKSTLESLPRVLLEGEIGSLTRARSGHLYLTLKDGNAVIDVVMWRSAATRLRFEPAEGEKVLVRGELSVYEPRGRYQLIASSMRPVGAGDLQAKFERLVEQLRAEGLFEPTHKKALPPMPRTVGVVTSATGAAVRDIVKVLKKRAPGVRVVVSPCVVQGKEAIPQIVAALERIDRWGECDVLIVGRGGGSLEDLWAFNEELVARAVFNCRTPVVSAVGHEVDLSVCDLVADLRAATPSEAAEIVAPDLRAVRHHIVRLERTLSQALRGRIREAKLRLRSLLRAAVLRKPLDLLRRRQQQMDETLANLTEAVHDGLDGRRQSLHLAAARLEALSPLGVLARGYSVTLTESNEVIHEVEQAPVGSILRTRLQRGAIRSRVTEIEVEGETLA